ncbi:MAG TPA: superoxide dismutase [Cu-Zn] SodC [Thermodesulfovibrionales bacterium]|nr:superoxide dismutase [Cu-Zn] SodC [Thermodesulfovibrionales bacterium]
MLEASFAVAVCVLLVASFVYAEEVIVKVNLVNEQGVGKDIGTVTAVDSKFGMILTPQLGDLTPGLHGFHVHDKPDCSHAMKDGKAVAAFAAGGHYDPAGTGKHEGPYGNGHLGDLPALYVASDGKATLPVLAPRLKVADIKGRSLMIHAGGDNYSDSPAPLGGGGARVACGVVK